MAVSDHQPPTRLVELVDERVDVGGDLGLQRDGKHLPSAVPDDLIKQRPTGRLVGHLDVVDYLEHERTFPNQRANAGPDQSSVTTRSSSGRCAPSRSPRRGPSTGSDHCSGKRAVGFKLSEGMDVPEELSSFKFARKKSKLAGVIRGSYFVIKGVY